MERLIKYLGKIGGELMKPYGLIALAMLVLLILIIIFKDRIIN